MELYEKLKIIDEELDEKINLLIKYAQKYPYLFSTKLENLVSSDLVNQDEINDIKKAYDVYSYITTKEIKSNLPKEIKSDLKKSKVGGVFGLAKEDDIFSKKYNIKPQQIIEIYNKYGSIDNFRNAYIQYVIDVTSANNPYKYEIITKNESMAKFIKELPVITEFNFCVDENYVDLAKKIMMEENPFYLKELNTEYNFFIFDKDLNKVLDKMLLKIYPQYKKMLSVYEKRMLSEQDVNSIPDLERFLSLYMSNLNQDTIDRMNEILKKSLRAKKIMEMRYGLNGEDKKTLSEIGQEFNITGEGVRLVIKEVMNCLVNDKSDLDKKVLEPNEDFITNLFQNHDIFSEPYEGYLNGKNVENILDDCKKDIIINDFEDIPIYDQDISVFGFRSERILRFCGLDTLEKIYKFMINGSDKDYTTGGDLKRIRNFGKTIINRIIEEMENAGYIFTEDNIISPKNKLIEEKTRKNILNEKTKEINETIDGIIKELNNGKYSPDEISSKMEKINAFLKAQQELLSNGDSQQGDKLINGFESMK